MLLRITDRLKSAKRTQGIGLLELMLALAIIAVLLIMATRYYQSTSQSAKANQAANDIQALIAGFANFRAGDQSTAINDISQLAVFIPTSIANSSTTANPWGGGYTVNSPAANPNEITIGMTGINKDACEAIAALTKPMMSDTQPSNCGSAGSFTGKYDIEKKPKNT